VTRIAEPPQQWGTQAAVNSNIPVEFMMEKIFLGHCNPFFLAEW
jgi:hypothetical protein